MDEFSNDIKSKIENYSEEEHEDDPKSIAYQIAEQVMTDTNSGFVIVGSPNMGETSAGYMYPDAIGLVINHEIGLTQVSLAAILEELARQLMVPFNEVENYLKEESNGNE